jgi:hypothetical protein
MSAACATILHILLGCAKKLLLSSTVSGFRAYFSKKANEEVSVLEVAVPQSRLVV